ncbi:MAG: porin [Ignavibacterium sp.]|uniref:porin n=1 Tax=Ignavibacterium sp. TaxID=2651167 RepID=UPI00404B07D3
MKNVKFLSVSLDFLGGTPCNKKSYTEKHRDATESHRVKFILTSIFLLILSFQALSQQKVDWNGYLQYRFSDNYLDQTNFSVRRAKFWVFGNIPLESGDSWNYKLQAIFHQQVNYSFLLQDVVVNYKTNVFEFTAGQFVPDFSMQRKQSDYVIPLVERSIAVNSLVPAAETMARDIGLEAKYINSFGSFSVGIFNGNGANNISKTKNFLIVNRSVLTLLNNSDANINLGYNLSYRNSKDIQFSKIFGNNYSFTGNDFRFGFEEKLNLGDFELQSEYLEAHLGDQKAYGFYILADYLIASKHLAAISVEQLNDLNPATSNDPWYIISYSYLAKENRIKFTLDNRFQFTNNKTNSLTTIQLQYFFN